MAVALPALSSPALEVAPHLLGLELGCGSRSGIIVEVEAYQGEDDPASHAWRGPTPRNTVMYGPAGRAYVYRSYGIHWCMNVVCGPEGQASAVLIRAVQPMAGLDAMWEARPKAKRPVDLTSGPGKLCAALGIDDRHYGADLLDPGSPVQLRLPEPHHRPQFEDAPVVAGPRVGISRATDRMWRFAIGGNRFVSTPRPASWAPSR